ncbi:hypothetical protein GJ744_012280 [Endocarpon pusillum]|uniref:Uncharacterized protein n=1 Tax=Endocarpon pusillum TaxID=364733 RepID=A0A8H7ABY6_9EURO|nr:hypothetical protein GJ744_012280 [Endocarpon pusillum]
MFTSAEYRAPSGSTNVQAWWEGWNQDKSDGGFRFFHHPSDPNAWFVNPTAPDSRPGPHCDPDNDQHLRFECQTTDLRMPKEWNSQSIALLHAQMVAKLPKDYVDYGSEFRGYSDSRVIRSMPPTWEFGLLNDDGQFMGYFRVPTHLANKVSHGEEVLQRAHRQSATWSYL